MNCTWYSPDVCDVDGALPWLLSPHPTILVEPIPQNVWPYRSGTEPYERDCLTVWTVVTSLNLYANTDPLVPVTSELEVIPEKNFPINGHFGYHWQVNGTGYGTAKMIVSGIVIHGNRLVTVTSRMGRKLRCLQQSKILLFTGVGCPHSLFCGKRWVVVIKAIIQRYVLWSLIEFISLILFLLASFRWEVWNTWKGVFATNKRRLQVFRKVHQVWKLRHEKYETNSTNRI